MARALVDMCRTLGTTVSIFFLFPQGPLLLMTLFNEVSGAGSWASALGVAATTPKAKNTTNATCGTPPTNTMQDPVEPDRVLAKLRPQLGAIPAHPAKTLGDDRGEDLRRRLNQARATARAKCSRGRDVETITTNTKNPRYSALMQRLGEGEVSRSARSSFAVRRFDNAHYSSGADATPREACGEAKNPGPPKWQIKNATPAAPVPGPAAGVAATAPKPAAKTAPKHAPKATPKPAATHGASTANKTAPKQAPKAKPKPAATHGAKTANKIGPPPQPASSGSAPSTKSPPPYVPCSEMTYAHCSPLFYIDTRHFYNHFGDAICAAGFAKAGFRAAMEDYQTAWGAGPADYLIGLAGMNVSTDQSFAPHPQHLLDFLTTYSDTVAFKFNIVKVTYAPKHQMESDAGLKGYVSLTTWMDVYDKDRPNLVCIMPHNAETEQLGPRWSLVHNFKQQSVVMKTLLSGHPYRRPIKLLEDWAGYIDATPLLPEPSWASVELEALQVDQFNSRVRLMREADANFRGMQVEALEMRECAARHMIAAEACGAQPTVQPDPDTAAGATASPSEYVPAEYLGLFGHALSCPSRLSTVANTLMCPEAALYRQTPRTRVAITMAQVLLTTMVAALDQRDFAAAVKALVCRVVVKLAQVAAFLVKRRFATVARALLALMAIPYFFRYVKVALALHRMNGSQGLVTLAMEAAKVMWDASPQTPPQNNAATPPQPGPVGPTTASRQPLMIRGAHPLHGTAARLNGASNIVRVTDPACWQNKGVALCECHSYPMCVHAAMPRVVDGFPMLGEVLMAPALVSRFDPLGFRDNLMAGSQVTVTDHVGQVTGWTKPNTLGARICAWLGLMGRDQALGVMRPVQAVVLDGTRYVMYPGLAEVLRAEYYLLLARGVANIATTIAAVGVVAKLLITSSGRGFLARGIAYCLAPGVEVSTVAIALWRDVLEALIVGHANNRRGVQGLLLVKAFRLANRLITSLSRFPVRPPPPKLQTLIPSGKWPVATMLVLVYGCARGYAVILSRTRVENVVTFHSVVPDLVTCADALAGSDPSKENLKSVRHAVKTTLLQQQGPAVLSQRLARLCNASEMDPSTYRKVSDLSTLVERAKDAITADSGTSEVKSQGNCNADRDIRKVAFSFRIPCPRL